MIIKWYGQGELTTAQLNELGIPFTRLYLGGIETGQVVEGIPVTRQGVAIECETMPFEDTLFQIDTLLPLCKREGAKSFSERVAKNVNLVSDDYRNAYKLSQLYGLTQAQLETYIDNNVTNLTQAKEFLKKLSAVVLWLVKQNKLDQ
jgi:hypothetical protein